MTSSADEDDGSLSCVVGRSGTQASSLPVNLRIRKTGLSLDRYEEHTVSYAMSG